MSMRMMREFSPMEIGPHTIAALTWTLKDTLGQTLDVLDDPVEFLVGGHDLLARIDEALQGHVAGDTLDLHLEPEEAFGDYDDQLVFLDDRKLYPSDMEEGMSLESTALPTSSSAREKAHDGLFTVTEIYPDHLVLDGNHPLAGIALRLHLKVNAVREATDEERERGSAGTGFFRIAPPTP
mgnify:CR=1 FL=1